MIPRHSRDGHALSYALLLLSLAAVGASADENFDCHVVSGELSYDLTFLDAVQTVSRIRDAPPTKYTDTVTFSICGEIPRTDAPENEQCPSGTKACLTKTNIKDGDADRVTEVVQLAASSSEQVSYESLSAPNKGISLTFEGASYPDPHTEEPLIQSFNINILCDTETSAPTLKSYNGSAMWVEWKARAGCPMGTDPVPTPDPNEGNGGTSTSMGSGLGYFFLLLLVAFLGYIGLGAYYNYSTYGATGLDLIPHRVFWREVPYMLRDVVSHLCSSVRSRRTSSRGGYIAV